MGCGNEEAFFPDFAKRRNSFVWTYCGWIEKPSDSSNVAQGHFNELVEHARRSDHGEERAVDTYPGGVVCYYREQAEMTYSGNMDYSLSMMT